MVSPSKRANGQFFTTENPFDHPAFEAWYNSIPDASDQTLLEPFAGACNLISMLKTLGYTNPWAAYDIEPVNTAENSSGVLVESRDTLCQYPTEYCVAITNPPYLARNSASRRDLAYPDTPFEDLYQECLSVMLNHTDYVAAIIPESFITQRLFFSRLHTFISLTCKMFEDTEVPVCLALFVPEEVKSDTSDFDIYDGSTHLGTYNTLKANRAAFIGEGLQLKFNDPEGELGLHAIDSSKEASIRFLEGDLIDSASIKVSSRSLTRIKVSLSAIQRAALISEANRLLALERSATHDVFMTSFKGLRKDGKYRRRLDFAQARVLLNNAALNLGYLPKKTSNQ